MSDVIFDASEDQDSGVADTSKQHYKDMIETGKLGDQCREVLKAVSAMRYIPTIDELANECLAGWQKSSISGRLNDLKDDNLVTDLKGDAKRKSKYSGVKSKVWSLTDKGEKLLEEIE